MDIDHDLRHLLGGMEMPTEEQQKEIFSWLPKVEELDEIGRAWALGLVLSVAADFRMMLRHDTDRWYTKERLEETSLQLESLGRAASALQAEIEKLNEHARIELNRGIDISNSIGFAPDRFAIAVALHFRAGRTREDALDPGIPFLDGFLSDRLADFCGDTVDLAERAIKRLQAPRKRGAPRKYAALALADRLADIWGSYSDRSLAPTGGIPN